MKEEADTAEGINVTGQDLMLKMNLAQICKSNNLQSFIYPVKPDRRHMLVSITSPESHTL